ncbi:hypothetical protein [Streptomyces sp. NPDC097610]|uniref:hypothetical protein n=1 Tax=Streptomyces sp. NPDC097610 TaxID=3157227 RepID=UPI00331D34EB
MHAVTRGAAGAQPATTFTDAIRCRFLTGPGHAHHPGHRLRPARKYSQRSTQADNPGRMIPDQCQAIL